MSRNLCMTDCKYCHSKVALTGPTHTITEDEAGVYLKSNAGMLVANAECTKCKALYLAWVDEQFMTPRPQYGARGPIDADTPFFDLSFRSTFNDEAGVEDMPIAEAKDYIDNLRKHADDTARRYREAHAIFERRWGV